MRVIAALLAGLLLTGTAQAQTAGLITACNLMEQAYKNTQKAGLQARPDILVGCPRYEAWKDTMTRKDNARAFRQAMGAKVPSAATQYGKAGKTLYQQMIARGVPVQVADGLVDSTLFKAAVASWGK